MTKSKMTENKTNIVYFTTICNLGCTYCYEHLDTVKPKNLSLTQLYKIADDAIEREDDNVQTMFVLFGGEATLRWNEAEKFMDYAYKKKSNVQFNLITNGIRFLEEEFFKDFFKNTHYNSDRLSIDISFDGDKGNADRIYKNGSSSTKDVLMVFSKFKAHNIKWRLRYTIHKNNFLTFVEDIEKICKHFNPQRVIKGLVSEHFGKDEIALVYNDYEILRHKWNTRQLLVPICELVCETCNGCSTKRNGIADYVDVKADIHGNVTYGEFNKFKKK